MKLDYTATRDQLESIYEDKTARRPRNTVWTKTIRPTLRAWGHALLKSMAGSGDPVIEERMSRDGKLTYEIYDPRSGDRVTCYSEREVRIWLEQRYYQS
jgi:hypothetical protein